MSWEKLSRKRQDRPSIGLTKHGRLTWNDGTHKLLGKPKSVLLFQDGAKLGIKAAIEDEEGSFHVCELSPSPGYFINVWGTLRPIISRLKRGYRDRAKWEGELVVLDLAPIL